MTSINSAGSLGNVISRLKGLKNVSGRKVMPGAEFLQKLEDTEPDVSGTSSPMSQLANLAPPPNRPEQDLGGELTPQSYDIRANSANPPQQEEGGLFSKLGRALAEYVNPKKREEMAFQNAGIPEEPAGEYRGATPEQMAGMGMQEELPSPSASITQPPEPSPGVLGALGDWLNPTKRSQMQQYNEDVNQNAQLRAQGKNPEEVRAQTQEGFNDQVQKAMEQPWQYAAYGSANEVANSPALQQEFKTITGIDYQPQLAAQIADHEAAMKGVEDSFQGINTSLDERAEGIKQRILNNQSTDADKYFIGLALLMPLLIGGLFGKEAGLGALSGGAQGFANVLGGRQANIRADEEALLDINKQQAGNQEKLASMALEKAQLPAALQKSLPKQPEEHLIGMEDIQWQDPATGKPMRGIQIKPGLVARSEYVSSEEGKKDMMKAANELSEVKTYVDEINDLTDDVVSIVNQLDDPTALWKGFTSIVSGKAPGSLSKLTQDVNFEGRKVNAGVLLEEKLGFLANAYGMAKELGQMDKAAQSHIKKIVDNPTSTLLTPEDTLNQILEVRKLSQRGLVRSAANKGFYPEFIIKDLESRNNELFGGLNQRAEDKQIAEIEKKLSQNETKYAK